MFEADGKLQSPAKTNAQSISRIVRDFLSVRVAVDHIPVFKTHAEVGGGVGEGRVEVTGIDVVAKSNIGSEHIYLHETQWRGVFFHRVWKKHGVFGITQSQDKAMLEAAKRHEAKVYGGGVVLVGQSPVAGEVRKPQSNIDGKVAPVTQEPLVFQHFFRL